MEEITWEEAYKLAGEEEGLTKKQRQELAFILKAYLKEEEQLEK